MKTPIALTLLAAFLAAPAVGAGAALVDVTVSVHDHYHLLPATKVCPVQVPAGANAGDALDAAVASGCLASWSHNSFPGFGRYVTAIDGRSEDGTYYWVFAENGATSQVGIDEASAAQGDAFQFAYGTTVSFFLP